MSYILEALTRSEQARQQAVAAPKYSLLPVLGGEEAQQRRWPYALAGALVVNAAVMYLWMRPTVPARVAVLEAPAVMRPVEAPAARVVPTAEAPVAPLVPMAPVAPVAWATEPAPRRDKPASAIASPVPVEARALQSPSVRVSERLATQTPAPANPPSGGVPKKPVVEAVAVKAAAPAPVAVAKSGTMPEAAAASVRVDAETQRKDAAGSAGVPVIAQPELPPVSISGFIRDGGDGGMVIVNDKLVREGDEVAPGLKLEQILHDSVVFNYKGYRFKR